MAVLSAQTIRHLNLVTPLLEPTKDELGNSYGLSACGVDIRVNEALDIEPGGFVLASAVERFSMRNNIVGIVHDKSSLARRGITVQNTVIEPGWRGFLTLEITNHSHVNIEIPRGCAIAQVLFHQLDAPTILPYQGKHQDQGSGPQEAR